MSSERQDEKQLIKFVKLQAQLEAQQLFVAYATKLYQVLWTKKKTMTMAEHKERMLVLYAYYQVYISRDVA